MSGPSVEQADWRDRRCGSRQTSGHQSHVVGSAMGWKLASGIVLQRIRKEPLAKTTAALAQWLAKRIITWRLLRHANLDLDGSGSAERNRALKFVTLHELLAGLQQRDVKALAVQDRF